MEGQAQAGGSLDTVLTVVDDHMPSGHIRMLEQRTQVLGPAICLQTEEWWDAARTASKFSTHGAHRTQIVAWWEPAFTNVPQAHVKDDFRPVLGWRRLKALRPSRKRLRDGVVVRLHGRSRPVPQLWPVGMAVHEIEAVVRDVDTLGTARISAETLVGFDLPQPARREVRELARVTQVGAIHAEAARGSKRPRRP